MFMFISPVPLEYKCVCPSVQKPRKLISELKSKYNILKLL